MATPHRIRVRRRRARQKAAKPRPRPPRVHWWIRVESGSEALAGPVQEGAE